MHIIETNISNYLVLSPPRENNVVGKLPRKCLHKIYSNHICVLTNRHCTCVLYVSYLYRLTWWRHDIDSLSAWVVLVRGFDQTLVDSPHKGPGMRSFDVSSHISLTKLLNNNRDACETRYLDALWPSLYLWALISYNKYQHIWYQCNVKQVARHDLRSRSTIICKSKKNRIM